MDKTTNIVPNEGRGETRVTGAPKGRPNISEAAHGSITRGY